MTQENLFSANRLDRFCKEKKILRKSKRRLNVVRIVDAKTLPKDDTKVVNKNVFSSSENVDITDRKSTKFFKIDTYAYLMLSF